MTYKHKDKDSVVLDKNKLTQLQRGVKDQIRYDLKNAIELALTNDMNYNELLHHFQDEYLQQALIKFDNNKSKAAEVLGIHRTTIRNWENRPYSYRRTPLIDDELTITSRNMLSQLFAKVDSIVKCGGTPRIEITIKQG